MFKGANVADITKIRQSDVFRKVEQTVVGMVTVPASIIEAEGAMPMATLLMTTDGGLNWNALTTPAYEVGTHNLDDEVYHEGHIFVSTAADNDTIPGAGDWSDLGAWNANGVLYNDLTESKKTTVVVTGDVVKKHLTGFDEYLRLALFKNKIIVK